MPMPMTPGQSGGDAEQELRALARYPKEQMLRALHLLAEGDEGVRRVALDTLAGRAGVSERSLRPVLLGLFESLERQGTKRDHGGYVRVAILYALKSSLLPKDVPLLERAAMTVEIGQMGKDVAMPLRVEALIALSDVAPEVGAHHAARLLLEKHTDEMSGEPALTAAKLLAAWKQVSPLYLYALMDGGQVAEVLAESLKAMAHLSAPLALELVGRHLQSRNEVVLVGVVDMVLAHEQRAVLAQPLFRFLADTRLYDVYHYAVTAMVASHDRDLLAGLLHLAEVDFDRTKRRSLVAALSLVTGDAEVERVVRELSE